MAIRVVMAGATGWVGKALVPAIALQDDMQLAGAVSRRAAGQDSGTAAGAAANGIATSKSLEEALAAPSDVVVDYTKPDAVKAHVLLAVDKGRHVVIGTSGLGAADYAEIDKAARANGVGVLAAGNFSITATLMKRFALMAAKYVPDVEVIDYASAGKPDAPSGTARELAEALADIRKASTSRPVARRERHTGDARCRGRSGRGGAGPCVAPAFLHPFVRGTVRPARRAPDHSPRRRLFRRPLCGGNVACGSSRGRIQGTGARSRRPDGLSARQMPSGNA